MKNKYVVFALLAVMLILVVASSPGITGLQQASISAAPTSTPAPVGQLDIPAVKIQFYVPGPNPMVNTVDLQKHTAGFFIGIFHGIISPGTLLVSFINSDVQMYEVHNKGGLYNLGFLLGAAVIFGFMGILTGRRRR
jgi:hypothetical protein